MPPGLSPSPLFRHVTAQAITI